MPKQNLRPYVQIARLDHWPKTMVELLGVVVALFVEPTLLRMSLVPRLALALLATCLVASSNYVLNELLDASTDRAHPVKRRRPAVSGRIRWRVAIAEWLGLGLIGLMLAYAVGTDFAAAALALWVMGVVYNVPPIRTKDLPYVDVATEAMNYALRLMLGWFILIHDRFPPVSLLLAQWMTGGFFLGLKRFAEYRQIGDADMAAAYRRAFAHYNPERLLASVFFYAIVGALFAGIFIVRYRLELILGVPVFTAFLTRCLRLAFDPANPFIEPRRLYQDRGFLLSAAGSLALFVLLLFIPVPMLYDLFNVAPPSVPPLWRLGAP